MFFGGDPFAGFAQQGARESSRGNAAEDVDTTKLYETLGVSRLRGCWPKLKAHGALG